MRMTSKPTEMIRKLLRARGDLQAALMALVVVGVAFDFLTWNEIQIASVEGAIALWMVVGSKLYDVDLERLARAEDKAFAENAAGA